jgi:hypothetical protein
MVRKVWFIWNEKIHKCSKMFFPGPSLTMIEIKEVIISNGYKKRSVSAAGISFAELIIRAKNKEEGIMSRLIHYFKNRQAKKHMKIRIKEWLFSERAEEAIPIAALPVKD